jgi:ribosomal protein S18 acetylase RimI-like enzyme
VSKSPEAFHYSVEPLGKRHNRTTFSAGSPALDVYFRTQSRQDIQKRVAATFVLKDTKTDAIAGFYSLSSTAVPLDEFPSEIAKQLPKYPLVPATLLARLAVDSAYRGRGLGEFLSMDALRRSLEQSRHVASAAVVVDAKDDAATAFYRKQSFLEFLHHPRRLFLPMKTVEQLF